MRKIESGKLFLGITLLVLGTLLLLEAFSLEFCSVLNFLFDLWPLFLIYIGFRKLPLKKAQKETPTPASS